MWWENSTKIESKSLDLKKESFNLNELISNIIGDYNRVSKEQDTNVKLEFTGPKEGIFIEADKGRINQVISNLLSNAIKFTKEGTITAAVVPNNNEIIVSINDTTYTGGQVGVFSGNDTNSAEAVFSNAKVWQL